MKTEWDVDYDRCIFCKRIFENEAVGIHRWKHCVDQTCYECYDKSSLGKL